MRGEKIIIFVSLMILSPIIFFFLMDALGSIIGGDANELNVLVAGITILCDVVIGCTLVIVGILNRLIRITKNPQCEEENKTEQ